MSNELDKHFGEQLRGYESDLDTEALWQSVKPPHRPYRRFWWLGLLLLLTIAAGGYWWVNTDLTKVLVEKSSVSSLASTAPDSRQQVEKELSPAATVGEEVPAAARPALARVPEADRAPISTAKATPASASSSRAAALAAGAPPPATGASLGPPRPASVPQASAEAKTQEGAVLPATEQLVETKSELPPPAEVLDRSGVAVSKLARSRSRLAYPGPKLGQTVERATFSPKGKGTGLFLGLEGGYFATTRNLTFNDSTAASAWLVNRQRTETVLDAWSSQVTLGYQHQSGWRIRTGVAFTQLTNVFEWTTNQVTIDTVEGVERIVVNPAGDSTLIMGPVVRYQTGTYFKRTYNRMQQWEVPILIAYRLQQGDWSLVLEAGPRFLLRRSWSGDVLNADNNISSWEETLEYRSSVSVQNVDVGAQLLYQLSPKLDLGLGLWGRIPLQDYGPDDAAQQERYRLLGGQVGLFYQL